MMRTLPELIDDNDPAWPMVEEWFRDAVVEVEVFPVDRATAETALVAAQVTTRSPMGAVVYHTAGVFIDGGWLRLLGAGGHARFERSLPGWNADRSNRFYLIADDAVGGSFALNGGAFGDDLGKVYYFAPDSLRWEALGVGYSDFLTWALSDRLAKFYETLRWDGWQTEVEPMTGDQSLSIVPFLFTQGPPLAERSRRPVPTVEHYALQLDLKRQLDGA
ncbi:MAG: DUF2625 family protein [Planctomycetia bacterium]